MNIPVGFEQSTNQFIGSVLGYTNNLTDEVNQLVNSIKESFKTNLYYIKNGVYKDLDMTKQYDVLVYDIKVNEQKKKMFCSYPYETFQFDVGNYLTFEYGGENTTWLITSIDKTNYYEVVGEIKLCNWILKFQSTDGTILSYPCIDSNPYNRGGEKEGTVITLGNTEKSITIPCDQNTILLRNERRFFIDKHPTEPKSYEIIGVNTTSKNYGDKGLIELTVKETTMHKDDRVDLGICDYFEPTKELKPVIPEVATVVVTISSDRTNYNYTCKLGQTYSFSSTFTNEIGEIKPDVHATYSVDNTHGGKVILIDNGDGTCTIKAGLTYDKDLITKQLNLICTDATSGAFSSILLTIIALF